MRRCNSGCCVPRFAILDELDSGLDFDALRMVGARVEAATEEDSVGVLAITHYSRLFEQLRPDTRARLCRGDGSNRPVAQSWLKSWRTPVTNVGVMRRRPSHPRQSCPRIRSSTARSPIRSLEACRWGRLLPWLGLC